MKVELFIAKRIFFSKKKGDKRVSSPAINIALAGVAIGLASMILAICIVIGFKNEVRNKVIGFGSHIQIGNIQDAISYQSVPVYVNDTLLNQIRKHEGVAHIQTYATAPGIIKTDNDFQGTLLMGVGEDYDWEFFSKNLIDGSILNQTDTTITNQILISQAIARKMKFKVGDKLVIYFVQEPVRARSFIIKGIYNTNFEDYDKLYAITNLSLVQRLNNWDSNKVTGIEVNVNDYDKLDQIKQDLFYDLLTFKDKDNNSLYVRSIKETNPAIFNWLDLLDMNVWIIILLMLIISVFTMTSGLLIIILENTSMIGLLKTLGMRNSSIRKVFLNVSSFLVIKGMIIGNIIALAIILLQKYTGFIKLDPETYYVSEMPVHINILYILLINIGTLIITIATMIGPSYLIAKISPVKSLRFE